MDKIIKKQVGRKKMTGYLHELEFINQSLQELGCVQTRDDNLHSYKKIVGRKSNNELR